MPKPAPLAGFVGLVVAAGVLTGCSGDSADSAATDTETYCAQLKADEKYFKALNGPDADPSQLAEAVTRLHDLADAAPDEIASEWQTLDGTLSELERALAEAGITTEDLAGLQSGEVPKGVDVGKLAKLLPKIQELNSPELQDAANAIQTHAKDECGITLNAQ